MSVLESIVTAMFSLSLVFAVLAILCAMVMVLSVVLKKLDQKAVAEKAKAMAEAVQDWDVEICHASSGELRLKNVDEKTAAMIMAIVSDESKVPLCELCFRSIAALD